jgi:hypothetical protein
MECGGSGMGGVSSVAFSLFSGIEDSKCEYSSLNDNMER